MREHRRKRLEAIRREIATGTWKGLEDGAQRHGTSHERMEEELKHLHMWPWCEWLVSGMDPCEVRLRLRELDAAIPMARRARSPDPPELDQVLERLGVTVEGEKVRKAELIRERAEARARMLGDAGVVDLAEYRRRREGE